MLSEQAAQAEFSEEGLTSSYVRLELFMETHNVEDKHAFSTGFGSSLYRHSAGINRQRIQYAHLFSGAGNGKSICIRKL
jgi:hypothetical protein